MTISELFSAAKELFAFLRAERDPRKQRLRQANHEYKVLKKAVEIATGIYSLEQALKTEQDEKKRKAYERKKAYLWGKFIRLLAIE